MVVWGGDQHKSLIAPNSRKRYAAYFTSKEPPPMYFFISILEFIVRLDYYIRPSKTNYNTYINKVRILKLFFILENARKKTLVCTSILFIAF